MVANRLIIPSPRVTLITNNIEPTITEGWLRKLIEKYVSLFRPPNREIQRLVGVKECLPFVSILEGPKKQIFVLLGESHTFETPEHAQLQKVLLRAIPADIIFLEGPPVGDLGERFKPKINQLSENQVILSELLRLT